MVAAHSVVIADHADHAMVIADHAAYDEIGDHATHAVAIQPHLPDDEGAIEPHNEGLSHNVHQTGHNGKIFTIQDHNHLLISMGEGQNWDVVDDGVHRLIYWHFTHDDHDLSLSHAYSLSHQLDTLGTDLTHAAHDTTGTDLSHAPHDTTGTDLSHAARPHGLRSEPRGSRLRPGATLATGPIRLATPIITTGFPARTHTDHRYSRLASTAGSTAAGGASHFHTIPSDPGHSHTGSAAEAGSHPHDATCSDADAMPHYLTGTDLTHNDADHHPKYYVGIAARTAGANTSCPTPAATAIVRSAREPRRWTGSRNRRRRCCPCRTSIWSSRCRTRSTR